MRGALVVFAKEPAPGRVKTRLCPPFTAEQAADFYAALLADVLEATEAVCERLGLSAVLAIDPPDAVARLRAPSRFQRVPQQGADLAARMEHALASQFAAGHAPVLLRGSDSPTLGLATIGAALEALATNDLVVCPDRDGGYNLIGLSRPAPGLFSHPMSTASVLAETLACAARLGLTHALLPAGFDLDTVGDLALLAAARRAGAERLCPRSLDFLDRHGLWHNA